MTIAADDRRLNEMPIDHDHFRSNRPEMINVIDLYIWRVIGRKTGAHFS